MRWLRADAVFRVSFPPGPVFLRVSSKTSPQNRHLAAVATIISPHIGQGLRTPGSASASTGAAAIAIAPAPSGSGSEASSHCATAERRLHQLGVVDRLEAGHWRAAARAPR